MSLDSILNSIDTLLIDVSDSLNRLITALTYFVPIFAVSFALLVVLVVVVAIASLILQCKRSRQIARTQKKRKSPAALVDVENVPWVSERASGRPSADRRKESPNCRSTKPRRRPPTLKSTPPPPRLRFHVFTAKNKNACISKF